jgi:hypothetical protein
MQFRKNYGTASTQAGSDRGRDGLGQDEPGVGFGAAAGFDASHPRQRRDYPVFLGQPEYEHLEKIHLRSARETE